MAQNISKAVMNSRIDPKDSLEHFPTPPWATRALCRYLEQLGIKINIQIAWDPACAECYMARALKEYFKTVYASDIHDYGVGATIKDFTLSTFEENPDWPGLIHWLITNPPFNNAVEFIMAALDIAECGVAMFVRSNFTEGKSRYENLFAKYPPHVVLQFTERVLLLKGRLRRKSDVNPTTGKKYSTATAYSWIIWLPKSMGSEKTYFDWIPPCEKQLERSDDYRGELIPWS